MLQCQSFMLQCAFLEHLEPSPPGRQHLETNTAQSKIKGNASFEFIRHALLEGSQNGRRAFHHWRTDIARAVTSSDTSNSLSHVKYFAYIADALAPCHSCRSFVKNIWGSNQHSRHLRGCSEESWSSRFLGLTGHLLGVSLVIQNIGGPVLRRQAFQQVCQPRARQLLDFFRESSRPLCQRHNSTTRFSRQRKSLQTTAAERPWSYT